MSLPPRTDTIKVKTLLGRDYDGKADLKQHIDTATLTVDRVATCAARKGTPLTPVELEMVERWLAAHNYCMNDPNFTSKSTEGASGSFAGQLTQGFDGSRYGQTAQRVDYSGCLRNLDKQQRASVYHVGGDPCLS